MVNKESITLLIPNKLPVLLQSEEYTQRITATLLLLKAIYPAGRFNKSDTKAASELCGFDSKRGFQNHLKALAAQKLITEEKNAAHKTNYVVFATWDAIKKHFNYERNFFIKYELEVYSSHRVMAILVSLNIQAEGMYHHSCMRANLNGNPELKEALETILDGDLSRKAIHRFQLTAFTEGLPKGKSDEYYYAAHMVLHATKTPKSATGEELKAQEKERGKASRFYLKADTNVSIGCLSRSRKYSGRNGMCYWSKVLEQYGLVLRRKREYTIAKKIRTTTEQRATGIGNTFYDEAARCLKIRLVDEWTFINPSVAFSKKAAELADMWKGEVALAVSALSTKNEKAA
jgi:hypothetical protein